MVTKLKHGCHVPGMMSNPHLFWSANLNGPEPLVYFEPVVLAVHSYFEFANHSNRVYLPE